MSEPVLREWRLIGSLPGQLGVLVGKVSGHPELRDGWIMTSQVREISDDNSWARTRSRLYRLEAQLPDDQKLPPEGAELVFTRLLQSGGTLASMDELRRLVELADTLSDAPDKRNETTGTST